MADELYTIKISTNGDMCSPDCKWMEPREDEGYSCLLFGERIGEELPVERKTECKLITICSFPEKLED
jgi:hypothetical protein